MSLKKKESPLMKAIYEEITTPKPSSTKTKKKSSTHLLDPSLDYDEESPSLVKSIQRVLNGGKNSIERLAFEHDPSIKNEYQALYRSKTRLLPDFILKRIAIQDDLVAAIIQARSNQMSAFGRPRPNRFETGFAIEPKDGVLDNCTEEQRNQLQDRINRAVDKFQTCGRMDGWEEHEKLPFDQYLYMSARNALVVGRLATEIIYTDTLDGRKEFHSFRVIDAGTIYRAAPQTTAAESVRRQARQLLEQVKNKRLEPERYQNDEYAWVQVIDGRPVQAFTSKECLVHNFFPVADVELDGYPVTPLDTVISAVTTHINITSHNKLYFQSGRATRGMLLIKSNEMDDETIAGIKQEFNARVNSVNNAWRMPVFGLGEGDEMQWIPIDTGTRDMEFQYLTDMNARVILSAFLMSPEELPGWQYLSRGTNNQALSESNKEYQLTAHRDVGIRPLIAQFQAFLNSAIFPLIDPTLAKLCEIKLVGLDAETAEKESVRFQQDMNVHLTINDIMEKVEKDSIPKELCGDILLNPQYQALLDKYVPVGQILESLMGIKGASKDPRWDYVRDPFYFQNLSIQMQMQQMKAAAQQQQAGGQPQPEGQEGGQPPPEQAQQQPQQGGGEITGALDQVIGMLGQGDLTKAEKRLPASRRRLLHRHQRLMEKLTHDLDQDVEQAIEEIVKNIK